MLTILRSYAGLALALLVLAAITVLAALHDPVPTMLSALLLAILGGQLALLVVATAVMPILAIGALGCAVALQVLGLPIPVAIWAALATAVSGHFALSLPSAPSSAANAPAAAATPAPASPPPAPAPAHSVTA